MKISSTIKTRLDVNVSLSASEIIAIIAAHLEQEHPSHKVGRVDFKMQYGQRDNLIFSGATVQMEGK